MKIYEDVNFLFDGLVYANDGSGGHIFIGAVAVELPLLDFFADAVAVELALVDFFADAVAVKSALFEFFHRRGCCGLMSNNHDCGCDEYKNQLLQFKLISLSMSRN